MKKFITGILKESDYPWDGDIDFVLETKVFDIDLHDYLHSISFPIEEAIKLFGHKKIENVMDGKSIKTQISIKKLFSRDELKYLRIY
jgi:hypothetical protein